MLFNSISFFLAAIFIVWRVYYKRKTEGAVTNTTKNNKLFLVDSIIAVFNALVLPFLISIITMGDIVTTKQIELQNIYNEACSHMDDGEYTKAQYKWERLLSEAPENARYHNKLGDTFYLLEEFENARDEYSIAKDIEPQNAEYIYDLGRSNYRLEDYAAAKELYESAKTIEPNNANYYVVLGWTYYNLEDYENACENFDKAVELLKNKETIGNTFIQYGMSCFRQNNLDEALRLFRNAVNTDSNNSEYTKYVTMIQNRFQVEDNPIDAGIHNRYGISLFDIRLYEDSIKEFQLAIQLDENNPVYYSNMAHAYCALKDYDHAESVLKDGLGVDEEDYRCNKMLERVKMERILEENSRNKELNFKYMRVCIELRDIYTAHETANKIKDIDPRNEKVDDYLALIAQYYAVKEDASNQPARYDLCNNYYTLKFYEQAKIEIERLIEEQPEEAKYRNYYGCILYEMEDYNTALESFQKATELDPENESYRENVELTKRMLY